MNNTEDRTKVLIGLIQNDSRSAFSELYRLYYQAVFRFCYKFLRSRDLANDCTQLAFMKIWECRDQIDRDQNFRGYIFTISKNAVLKSIEKAARERTLKEKVLEEYRIESLGDSVSTEELEKHALMAFEQLPRQRQLVFKLCKIEGKSYEEAALDLDISRGTVRDHLFKASKTIKRYLALHRLV